MKGVKVKVASREEERRCDGGKAPAASWQPQSRGANQAPDARKARTLVPQERERERKR